MMLFTRFRGARIVSIFVPLALLGTWFMATEAPATSRREPSLPLVIVGGDFDRDLPLLRRIAGHTVEVRALHLGRSEESPVCYETCNRRVLAMRSFALYFAGAGTACPCEQAWQQRLRTLNPAARFSRFRPEREATDCHWRRAACLARAFHRELVGLVPHRREELDANLAAELARSRRLQASVNSPDDPHAFWFLSDE